MCTFEKLRNVFPRIFWQLFKNLRFFAAFRDFDMFKEFYFQTEFFENLGSEPPTPYVFESARQSVFSGIFWPFFELVYLKNCIFKPNFPKILVRNHQPLCVRISSSKCISQNFLRILKQLFEKISNIQCSPVWFFWPFVKFRDI